VCTLARSTRGRGSWSPPAPGDARGSCMQASGPPGERQRTGTAACAAPFGQPLRSEAPLRASPPTQLETARARVMHRLWHRETVPDPVPRDRARQAGRGASAGQVGVSQRERCACQPQQAPSVPGVRLPAAGLGGRRGAPWRTRRCGLRCRARSPRARRHTRPAAWPAAAARAARPRRSGRSRRWSGRRWRT